MFNFLYNFYNLNIFSLSLLKISICKYNTKEKFSSFSQVSKIIPPLSLFQKLSNQN